MSCAFGKVRVETTRPVGCEIYAHTGADGQALPSRHPSSFRMMQADVAEREGLSGEPMEPTGQDSRIARLMLEAAEQRERAERLSEALDAAQRRIAHLNNDLATATGANATPQDGSAVARVIVGDAYVQVEYDYTPAEDAVMDVESPVCGPGHPEEITPLRVFINGYWCGLQDVQAALDDDTLIERIGAAS